MTSENSDLRLRSEVLLTFQVSLLGMVEPSLRGVTVAWSESTIIGHLLFSGKVGVEEQGCASEIEAELAASFPNHEIEVTAVRYDFPEALNKRELAAWVYRRKE